MINNNSIEPVRVRPLPLPPSNTGIILPGNARVALLLLQTVESEGLHLPPKKISSAIQLLWTRTGNGPLDSVFSQWASARRNRQIKDRFDSILDHYANYDTQYPSQLEVIAKRLSHERDAAVAATAAARAEEERRAFEIQMANDHREGQLGLIPPGHGAALPGVDGVDPAVREQMAGAANLLAINPHSQNDAGESESSMEGVSLMEFMGYNEMDYLEGMEDHAHDFARRFG